MSILLFLAVVAANPASPPATLAAESIVISRFSDYPIAAEAFLNPVDFLDDTLIRDRGLEVNRIIFGSVSEAIQALKWIRIQRDVILHNLANVSTHGFKRMNPWTWMRQFSQGAFHSTESQFHLAIEGSGFFPITLADGSTAYTRDGSFERDFRGQIMTRDGFILEPPIVVSPKAVNVEINQEGEVTEQLSDGTLVQIGQVQLVNFINPGGLQLLGKTIFRETFSSGSALLGKPGENGSGFLRQGFVEISNVDLIEEEFLLESLRHQEEALRFALQSAGYKLPKH